MAIKDLINQLEKDNTLTLQLDAYLESGVQKRKPDGMYHPSMAGDCPRAIWYYQTGVESTPFTGEVMRKMDNGTDAHRRMQRYYSEMGILLGDEVEVKCAIQTPAPKIIITGSCDGILDYNGEKVWEFKTTISWNFNQVVKNNKPLDGHFEQWCCYSYGLRKWKGIIEYENKDTQQLHPIEVEFDKKVFKGVVDKFKLVQVHIKKGVVPERPYKGMSDKKCLWCNYRDVCWERKKKG